MDLDKARQAIALMEEAGLSELEIEQRGFKLRLKKTPQGNQIVSSTETSASPEASSSAAEDSPKADDGILITAQLVGTFYRAPSPESKPFVEVGSRVSPEKALCIIEAMKVMNEIHAEHSGVIEEIFVENGQAVEFGQPLFRLRP